MKINSRDLLVSILVLLSVCLHAFAQNPPRQIKKQFMPADRRASRTVAELPRFFEENKGQADTGVKFLSRGKNFNLLLTNNQAVYQMPDAECQKAAREKSKLNKLTVSNRRNRCRAVSLQMTLDGARRDAAIAGAGEIPARTDYYAGSDESRWQRGIANFESVRYRGIYDGIDAIFRGAGQDLEYDFVVAPGADPDAIRLRFDGAKKMSITAGGELVFKFGGVEIRHRRPVAYQMADGERREVAVKFVRREKNLIGFETGAFDASLELIIDPIVYASYLGGTAGGDGVNDIAVDREGNIYTATDARVSRLEPDGFLYTYSDVLISKFTPDGRTAVYFKYIGGSFDDVPYALDVEADGAAVVTGQTYSPDFPLRFAAQSTHPISRLNYDYTGFFIRLYADGDIRHSTYLGGSCPDEHGYSVAADTAGNAYVTGYTCSADFAAGNGFQTSRQGSSNAFLTKFDALGHIAYSTFFGTAGSQGFDVFAGESGKVWVTGFAGSGVPTTAGAYSATETGFLAKFDTNVSGAPSLVYSTRIPRLGTAVAADRSGNTWIAISPFPFRSFDTAKVIKLNNTGSQLLFESQNFGQQIRDLAVDGNGSAYFAVNIWADNFSGGIRSKIYALRPNGDEIDTAVIEATRDDRVLGIALGPEPDIVYVGGKTNSLDFPTTPGAYQPTPNSPTIFGQGFFAKVQLNIPIEKEPLIFIPGIAGSWLDAVEPEGSRTNLWIGLLQNHERLTLDPNQTQTNIIASDAIRTVNIPVPIPGTVPQQFFFFFKDAYRPILERLVNNENYVEYQVDDQPTRRTLEGCDISGQMTNKPTLFVFAYDWRKSNIENSQALKEYIKCVRRFYPESKVNILAHSMGGLLARRYIISNPSDHHINKMITIGSPWLGAPKAIEVLETGNFGLSPVIWNSTIRRLGEFFKGMHELLPSRTYFNAATRSDFHLMNYGDPFKEDGWDINGNGESVESYSYNQMINLLNQQQSRSNPGSTGQIFHDTIGQDNWLNDTSGVEYLHIYGQQSFLKTTIQVIAKKRVKCRLGVCRSENYFDTVRGRGDGTVPTISAERSFGPYYDLLPRNDKPFFSANRSQDESVEHTNLTHNPEVQQEVINFLNSDSQQFVDSKKSALKDASSNLNDQVQGAGAESIELPLNEGYYVNISGINYVEIKDDLGNVNSQLDGGYLLPVPNVSYEITGEKSITISAPAEGVYTLTFLVGNESIFLETIKGIGNLNPSEIVRYLDLNLPANVKAQFQISSSGVTNLRYDSDGNGSFETPVMPTSRATGNAAKDLTPPEIQINEILHPLRQLAINASDNLSEISKIYYSLDGTNFQEYFNPIHLSRTQSGTLFTFAEDISANRSSVKTFPFNIIPDPIVTINALAGGIIYPTGNSINFTGSFSSDSCNTHTAIWKFNNASQNGVVNESTRNVSTNYSFTSAGVYLIELTVSNSCGGTGTANTIDGLIAMIVIYDPDGGFVTGGGWFDSPFGAYTSNPDLKGRASFGFNSKYKHGATVPTGNTEFQFRIANFNFKSTSYDWLVIGGAKAQFKGSGTINGIANYGFLLTAIDGHLNGGGGQDKFRIKIWDKTTGSIIYDNHLGRPDSAQPTTVIGGGSIVIHRQ